jgi:hypothetical protein
VEQAYLEPSVTRCSAWNFYIFLASVTGVTGSFLVIEGRRENRGKKGVKGAKYAI